MILFRPIAAPALNAAVGWYGETSTACPDATADRVSPSRRRRSTPSGRTPTTRPSAAKAARIAVTSMPRAPPDTTASPPRAVAVARRSVKAIASASASREPTIATPPRSSPAASPLPNRTGGASGPRRSDQPRRVGLVGDGHDPDATRSKAIEFEGELPAARQQRDDPLRLVSTDLQRSVDLLGRELGEVPRSPERLARQALAELRPGPWAQRSRRRRTIGRDARTEEHDRRRIGGQRLEVDHRSGPVSRRDRPRRPGRMDGQDHSRANEATSLPPSMSTQNP